VVFVDFPSVRLMAVMLESGGDFVPIHEPAILGPPSPYVSFIALFSFDLIYSAFLSFLELLTSHLKFFNDS
jgi:hypothetical protein